jgi:hypothetical protein
MIELHPELGKEAEAEAEAAEDAELATLANWGIPVAINGRPVHGS